MKGDFTYLSGFQLLRLLHEVQSDREGFEHRIVEELTRRQDENPNVIPAGGIVLDAAKFKDIETMLAFFRGQSERDDGFRNALKNA